MYRCFERSFLVSVDYLIGLSQKVCSVDEFEKKTHYNLHFIMKCVIRKWLDKTIYIAKLDLIGLILTDPFIGLEYCLSDRMSY